MTTPDRYLIGPGLRAKLRDVIARVDGTKIGGNAASAATSNQGWEPRQQPIIRLGKTTNYWPKGTLATIAIYDQGEPLSETSVGDIVGVTNKTQNVQANKWVWIARAANGYWYLVSAECG